MTATVVKLRNQQKSIKLDFCTDRKVFKLRTFTNSLKKSVKSKNYKYDDYQQALLMSGT